MLDWLNTCLSAVFSRVLTVVLTAGVRITNPAPPRTLVAGGRGDGAVPAMPTLIRWAYSGSHTEHHAEQRVFVGDHVYVDEENVQSAVLDGACTWACTRSRALSVRKLAGGVRSV